MDDRLRPTGRHLTHAAPVDLEARFWAKVDRSGGPDACWPWTAAISEHGYGTFSADGKTVRAHRIAYRLASGRDAKADVDHTCHNGTDCAGGPSCPHRRCVNPEHLEDVPRRVNRNRGQSINVRGTQSSRTHCPQRHPYTPENTWRDGRGYRFCRTCNRDKHRARARPPRRNTPASINNADR